MQTKLLDQTKEHACLLYRKILRISSILHGDVYCATRMRFGMTDNDRCVRCFDAETFRVVGMDELMAKFDVFLNQFKGHL